MSALQKLVLDTGPFLLTFTDEGGSEKIRSLIKRHENGEAEVSIHPNNLAEGYRVISVIQASRGSKFGNQNVDPSYLVRSAYASLSVIQNEITTINLGKLKMKYPNKPWGDLSSAALALSLSTEGTRVPVVILQHERHFSDISEVKAIRISEL